MAARTVVVSNRVPVAEHGGMAPGGLVSALAPVLRESRSLWFGWSGCTLGETEDSGDGSGVSRSSTDGIEFLTVDLTDAEVQGYYLEFSNQVLWPALHGLPEHIPAEARPTYSTYRAVNRRLASVLAPELQDDDLVWVQDYHLIPFGEELRAEGFRGRIGYFHHVPIPDVDAWNELPLAGRLAASLGAYDLIGVQTEADARRLRSLLDPDAAARTLAFPISIDPDEVRAMARTAEDETDRSDSGSLLYFGVDRLDYTKGIPLRLKAYRTALLRRPDLRDASLVQWSAPSRSEIDRYQDERRAVEAAASALAEVAPDVLSISYLSRQRADVLAMLERADVCLVTSVADGMNLVAKEFAALHSADNPGILILSDACGAAEEMGDALVYPSGDVDALTARIIEAYDMAEDERRARACALRQQVDQRTSADWAAAFLKRLAAIVRHESAVTRHDSARDSVVGEPITYAVDPELAERTEERLRTLEHEGTLQRLWAHDHRIWTPEPTEVSNRLGWLELDSRMRTHVARIQRFTEDVGRDGFTSVLVLGMGGSAMAARVYAATSGASGLALRVLDSTVPEAIREVEESIDLDRTLFIVSSKSGSTAETTLLMDHFWDRYMDGRRFVVITDPGSALHETALERGFRDVFLNPADIGGRFSALSFYGLVPASLAGVDVALVLDGASSMREACTPEREAWTNPGARLGATLAEAALLGRDVLALRGERADAPFGAWIEQLVAESTGKDGKGLLPALGSRRCLTADYSGLMPDTLDPRLLEELAGGALEIGSPFALGEQYYRWEFGVAVAGAVLDLNPFDQPDVEATKTATIAFLEGATAHDPSHDISDVIVAHAPDEYVAIHAYLGGGAEEQARLRRVRDRVEEVVQVPTLLEYGPSFLHSTGQYHKAGARRGSFIQVNAGEGLPLPASGGTYTFGEFTTAQAAADRLVLQQRNCAVALGTLTELEEALPWR